MATTDRDVLPNDVKPYHYDLKIHALELGGAFTYRGIVTIELNVIKSTREIVLNAHQLEFDGAEVLLKHEQSWQIAQITFDESSQRVTLKFHDALSASTTATLKIRFTGTINNVMAGFYRSKYKPAAPAAASVPRDDEYHYMFSTQFESCDARRAFPCFDEPNLKATFDVTIEIPNDLVALSNMPVKKRDPSDMPVRESDPKAGLQQVIFERTPIMSTYLLAWAVGDFEYVEDFTKREYRGKKLPVRVYTTRGLKEQGRFALQNAHQIVDYYSEVFGIDYPLPKADLLAVHEFSHGAMENWGLVTYRTTAVLFDEARSDARYKNRVAYVVAHELAHQWFGNLVTMDWWSELWLNEGFATWVGWLAIDHLYPDWNVWGQFVTESVQPALQLDSLRGSHPIEVPVKDALDIDQIFDHISYLKGSSVIRMLSTHLGVKTFLSGVSSYLKAHEYGNATTHDLWQALSKASGQDITQYMDNWIRKIGFPVLNVGEAPGQILLRQARFLSTGDVAAEEDQTLWWIPLGLQTDGNGSAPGANALHAKEDTIGHVGDFYKLNADQTGFYRTNYPPARLAALAKARERLTVEDKIGLIGDIAALAVSGHGTSAGLLSFLEAFSDEKNYLVWSQIAASLANMRSIFADHAAVAEGLKKFTLKLVSPAVDKVGWNFAPGEDFLTGQLRALLIVVAGDAGHTSIIQEAQRRFRLSVSGTDPSAVHPNLRSAIFRIAIAEGGSAEYEAVKAEYLHPSTVDGKEICLQSLGRVPTAELATDFLDFIFSAHVAMQDKHSGAIALAANAKVRLGLWQYLKLHWTTTVQAQLAGNSVVMDRFLKQTLTKFASHEVDRDIAEFFRGKDNRGYDRALGVISDTIRGNATYKERDEALVLEWLKAHGYA
ncbi:MAG: hypothetical protein M1826_003980 [Phylliscum demangeonii]|nr:MAG: hypothetical protein M1826_003980 [Phylliscum demangeonii]